MKIDESLTADLVTLLNGFVGLLAIMYIIDGEFRYGMVLILLGILIDGADGILSRFINIKKTHGIYLDSIADMVTFCFAPSILIYGVYYDVEKGTSFQNLGNALTVTASMLIVLFGILRLARFIEKGHKSENFIGLPTPAAALVIVMCVDVIPEQLPVLTITILISLLMISRITYPKLHGIFIGVAGLVIFMGILALWFQNSLWNHVSTIVLALASIYLVIGPLYGEKIRGEWIWM